MHVNKPLTYCIVLIYPHVLLLLFFYSTYNGYNGNQWGPKVFGENSSTFKHFILY